MLKGLPLINILKYSQAKFRNERPRYRDLQSDGWSADILIFPLANWPLIGDVYKSACS